ncbi:MAG: L-threonylcarbamoyladenylate synthase [bacterium]
MSLLDEAVEALARGMVVGVPTDTVYGVGVDPWNEVAVDRLYRLKDRPARRPVGLLAADEHQASQVADLAPAGELLRHWPGAVTFVVRPTVVIPDWVGDSVLNTVGVRVPDHDLLRELLARTGPLAVTSANRSGDADTLDDRAARRVFGAGVAVYLPGSCPGGASSTVVDLTGRSPRVLRQGPVVIDGGDD